MVYEYFVALLSGIALVGTAGLLKDMKSGSRR